MPHREPKRVCRDPAQWHVPEIPTNPTRRHMRKLAMHALRRSVAWALASRVYGIVAIMQGLAWFKAGCSVARSCRSDEEIVRRIFGLDDANAPSSSEIH